MGHGVSQFKETLLGATIIAYMSLSDRKETNIQSIWKQLYPKHAKAIDRIWERSISAAEKVMKAYRDQAGAHGDNPIKYFEGKMDLTRDQEEVKTALAAFLGLSIIFLRRQADEVPELSSEIEAVLLDVELRFPPNLSFNRRWLRTMHLIESGPYKRTF